MCVCVSAPMLDVNLSLTNNTQDNCNDKKKVEDTYLGVENSGGKINILKWLAGFSAWVAMVAVVVAVVNVNSLTSVT